MNKHVRFGRFRLTIVALVSLGLVGLAAVGLVNEVARSDSPIPPEKQEYIDREERLRAEALANPPPPGAEKPDNAPPPGTPEPRQKGIQKIWQAPIGYKSFVFTNVWEGDLGGAVVRVYAGGDPSRGEPAQGLVVVLVFTAKLQPLTGDWGTYRTPFSAGSLRIVDAVGDVLALTAEDGTKVLFDVASRQFLAPDTLVPLATVPASATPTPRPDPVPVTRVGIDTDVAGGSANSATSLGARQSCSPLAPGGTLTIDIIADSVPGFDSATGAGGITAFQFALHYDPSVVRVVAADHGMLLAANPGYRPISMGDGTPDSDGTFVAGVADFDRTAPESGAGVLSRITLEAVGKGVSPLTLSRVKVQDGANNTYAVDQLLPAQIAVDAPCP